jgi:hypothetical protein
LGGIGAENGELQKQNQRWNDTRPKEHWWEINRGGAWRASKVWRLNREGFLADKWSGGSVSWFNHRGACHR